MNNCRSSEKLVLFQNLKFTVEKILSHYSHDVWSVHGGLQSLIHSLDSIFKHGIKPQTGLIGLVVDYWLFVRGLRWLDPVLALDIDNLSKLPAALPAKPRFISVQSLPQMQRSQLTHGEQWIEKSLKDRNFTKQLTILLSDENHVEEHYHEWAFLMDPLYTTSALTCIAAVEQNSPALLGNLPTSLFIRRVPSQITSSYHQSITDASGDTANVNTLKGESSLTKDYKEKPRTESISKDPLNATVELQKRSPTKYLSSRKLRSSSCSELPRTHASKIAVSHEVTPDSSNKNPLVNIDQQTICNIDDDKQKMSLQAREPLFEDSSDEDGLNLEDLGFLLMSESQKPKPNNQVNTYFSTVDINPNSGFTPKTMINLNSDLTIANKNTLPDLVISAQTSRYNRMDKDICEKKTDLETHKNKGETKAFSKDISSSTKKARVSKHRRCRSDQIHVIKRTEDSQTDISADFESDFRGKRLSNSSSSSYWQSSYGHPISPESPLSRSTSLINYLKNQDFTTCADIDKENAHFDFSEILISAMEQMKCKMQEQKFINCMRDDQHQVDDLNPSVSESYQSPIGSFLSYDSLSANTPTSHSGLPFEFENNSPSSHESNLMATKSNEVPLKGESLRTAESIAIGLLQSFSDQRRVTASEFDWLISEDVVPQKLLPIPESTAIDPDFSDDQGIRIRGNQVWAPPRPQIIFQAPVRLKLKNAMSKQNNRCAGCGTYVEKEFMKRFRYCEYTGKYFCTCCHDNKLSIIPANILSRFDFTKCRVSNFAYDLVDKISFDPLFNIEDINPSLYKKVRNLTLARELRFQMFSLYKYIQLCRFADNFNCDNEVSQSVKKVLTSRHPEHLLSGDLNVYSLQELDQVKSGELLDQLKSSVELASDHVTTCELCHSKGYLCEVCRSDDVIFPHQSGTVTCRFCQACFHKQCFVASDCPKCARLLKRKEAREELLED